MWVAACNTGDGDTYDGVARVLEKHPVKIIAWSEMLNKDRQRWDSRMLRDFGFKSLLFDGIGTGVSWNPDFIKCMNPARVPVLAGGFVGPGPGPMRNSPKVAVGGGFRLFMPQGKREVDFNFWSVHQIPGSDLRWRRKKARTWADNVCNLKGIKAGDFNTNYDSDLMNRVMARDDTNNHIELRPIVTLPEHRKYDSVVYPRDYWEAVEQGTYNTKIDHHLLRVRLLRKARA
jgi:hypothetical protein